MKEHTSYNTPKVADDSEHRYMVCLESAMAQLFDDLQEILGCDEFKVNTTEPVKLAARLCSCLVLIAFRTVDALTGFLQTSAVFQTHTATTRSFTLHSYPIFVA